MQQFGKNATARRRKGRAIQGSRDQRSKTIIQGGKDGKGYSQHRLVTQGCQHSQQGKDRPLTEQVDGD